MKPHFDLHPLRSIDWETLHLSNRMGKTDAARRMLALHQQPVRLGRWQRLKDWLSSNVKACKGWRLGRCYGMSRRPLGDRDLGTETDGVCPPMKTTLISKLHLSAATATLGLAIIPPIDWVITGSFILMALCSFVNWDATRQS